jgi:hypothetical protein
VAIIHGFFGDALMFVIKKIGTMSKSYRLPSTTGPRDGSDGFPKILYYQYNLFS